MGAEKMTTTSNTASTGVFNAPARNADIINFRSTPRATLSEPVVTWEKPVRDRLDRICALQEGWDGYRGKPTRFVVADFAFRLLRAICKPHTPAPFIAPLPSGGLQVEWHTAQVQIELTVRAPFQVEAWLAEPHVDDEGTEIALTSDFTDVLPWVQKLGGQLANQSAA